MSRRIFIGDIQGCREELEQLLEALSFHPADDALHPVGDLVNRGPDSAGVLRLLRKLGAKPVLGNHDLHLLATARGLRTSAGRDTITDVLQAPDASELLEWLAAQPFLRVFDDLYQVHAGLSPTWVDPEQHLGAWSAADPASWVEPDISFATRVRYCDLEGNRPACENPRPWAPFAPWYEFYRPERHGGRKVVYGHWAQRGLVQTEAVLGLDTGCVYGKSLTAWIPEEERLVSVPATAVHCPIE